MATVKTRQSLFNHVILSNATEGFYSYVLEAPFELSGHIFVHIFVSFPSVMNVRG